MQFGNVGVAEPVKQARPRLDGIGLDVDTAKGARAERPKRRQHDAAARAHLQHVRARYPRCAAAQHLDQRGGVLARAKRRIHRQGKATVEHALCAARSGGHCICSGCAGDSSGAPNWSRIFRATLSPGNSDRTSA